MKFTTAPFMALAAVLLCVLAACETTTTGGDLDIRADRVSMTRNLSSYLTVEGTRLDLIGGVPTAQVTIRNGGPLLKLNPHFVWFNSVGVQVGAGGSERDDVFRAGQTRIIRGIPAIPGATDYKLVMRHR